MKNLSEKTTNKRGTHPFIKSGNYKNEVTSKNSRFMSFLSSLKIGSVFAGAVLGAGFAGGKELTIFFVRYGYKGVMASLLAGILFLIFGTSIIYKSKITSSESYSDYLKNIFPSQFAKLMEIISNLFLMICFIIMFSGAGALFNECFNVPSFFGITLTALIVFFVLKGGMESIGSACSILTPIMALGIISVDFFSIYNDTVSVFASETTKNNAIIFSSLLYVSYNLLSSAPVLCEASSLAADPKTAINGGIFGGIILSTIAFTSCLALYMADSEILACELPLLMLSAKTSRIFHIIYATIIYIAILTTAFSSGFPLLRKIEKYLPTAHISPLLLCSCAIPLSFLKFSVLVEKCYTFFGALGMILIIVIFYDLFKRFKK